MADDNEDVNATAPPSEGGGSWFSLSSWTSWGSNITNSLSTYMSGSTIYEENADEKEFTSEEGIKRLTCANCPPTSAPIQMTGWDFFNKESKIKLLNEGATFFTFCARRGGGLEEKEKKLLEWVINMSAYENEVEQNGVPHLDPYNADDTKQYTTVITKACYLLPGLKISDITPELIASSEYQAECVPGKPYIWPEVPDNTSFRITKTIIPYVYNITIQFKVTSMTPQQKEILANIDGYPVHHGIFMERTKRNIKVQDATRKCKTLLLYREVEGGLVCTHMVFVLNSFIPDLAVPIVDKLGWFGVKEGAITAELTRAYMKKKTQASTPQLEKKSDEQQKDGASS